MWFFCGYYVTIGVAKIKNYLVTNLRLLASKIFGRFLLALPFLRASLRTRALFTAIMRLYPIRRL